MLRTVALFLLLLYWIAYPCPARAQAPLRDGQRMLDSVWQYYDNADSSGMYKYLSRWTVHSPGSYSASDSIRQLVKGLFRTWFERFYGGGLASGKDRVKPHHFLVFQDRLAFAEHSSGTVFANSLREFRSPVEAGWLMDFCPEDPDKRHAVLLISDQLSDALSSFLNGYREFNLPVRSESLSDPKCRLEFLRMFFPVGTGHWGAYYHFETLPHWYRVDLSPDHCEARIEYMDTYYSGSILVFRREGNTWVRVHTDTVPYWME